MKIIWAMTLFFCVFGLAGLNAACQAKLGRRNFLCDGSLSEEELENAGKNSYEGLINSFDLGRI